MFGLVHVCAIVGVWSLYHDPFLVADVDLITKLPIRIYIIRHAFNMFGLVYECAIVCGGAGGRGGEGGGGGGAGKSRKCGGRGEVTRAIILPYQCS